LRKLRWAGQPEAASASFGADVFPEPTYSVEIVEDAPKSSDIVRGNLS
jgi:hypothetical protein